MWLLSALGELTEGILHRHYWDTFIHTPVDTTVTGGKSKDSAIIPETTQTHSHTPLPAWRIAEQRDPSTQDFKCSMEDVTLTLATFRTTINLV